MGEIHSPSRELLPMSSGVFSDLFALIPIREALNKGDFIPSFLWGRNLGGQLRSPVFQGPGLPKLRHCALGALAATHWCQGRLWERSPGGGRWRTSPEPKRQDWVGQ